MASLEENSTQPLLGRKNEKDYTLDEAIESIGVGKFHIILMLITGFAWVAESMEMMVISILSPILTCDWNLSSYEEAIIATSVFIGTHYIINRWNTCFMS